METHEEIMKMLNNICEQITRINKDHSGEDDVGDDEEFNLTEEVKQIQTILYQLWLRLLEWECLLEQQLRGPARLDQVSFEKIPKLSRLCFYLL